MNLPKYPIFASEEKHEYGFFSEGPMGKIRKVVRYEKIGNDLFNLGFGDWDEGLQGANDSNRSNNEDRDKVLNTVASTAIVFTDQFPNSQLKNCLKLKDLKMNNGKFSNTAGTTRHS